MFAEVFSCLLKLYNILILQDVISELEQFKSALRKLFKSEGKTCVIFERNFRTQHLQIQVRLLVPEKESRAVMLTQLVMRSLIKTVWEFAS